MVVKCSKCLLSGLYNAVNFYGDSKLSTQHWFNYYKRKLHLMLQIASIP